MQQLEATDPRTDASTLLAVTRDLVGVAMRSLAPESVTLPQFRLLLVLHEQGTVSSAQVARSLGLAASSVTRLGDRLVESGHVARGNAEEHRGMVTLSLTRTGRALVKRVEARRERELSSALECLDPTLRFACIEGLRAIHELLSADETIGAVTL